MAKQFRSKLYACIAQANPTLNTSTLFDATYKETKDSPIDEFLTRLKEINKLSPSPTSFEPLLGQLVLLGVVAAVESYLRTILRRLILVDPICQESVHRREVSFGAALHLDRNMLPEAILEKISFISKSSIADAIRDLAGIKGQLPADLDTAIEDYVRICQLRHCAVHRFGKLGVSNAISLGLENHKELLEKPLRLDYPALQSSIAISSGLVKTINNFLFNEIVSRIPESQWTGTYTKDKKLFNTYYSIFSDTITSSHQSANLRQAYHLFMSQRACFAKGQAF